MSDDVSIYGDDGHDYHSRFDLGLEMAAMETIKWLILGHLLFLAGMAFALLARIEMGPVWITPLFGLPLLWAGRKQRQTGRILVFLIGFTAVHYLAVTAATQTVSGSLAGNPMLPGLYAGAIGAVGSFALCMAFRLFREGPATLVLAAFGIVILAGAGSVGVYMLVNSGGGDKGFASQFIQLAMVYSPWQLLFAYFLAKTLKPIEE